MRAAVKSLLLVACAGLVLALGTAAPAVAGIPCWQAVINDWYDGKIDHTYPTSCYQGAIQHLPTDVKTYSSAKDDIERALRASIRKDRANKNKPPRQTSSTTPKSNGPGNQSGNGNGNRKRDGAQTASPERSQKGAITRAIEWLGPSNAASVPLPLLILAAVAFLLLAAAGGSFVNRRVQERRPPPPPQ
jgi:hypothetical protein